LHEYKSQYKILLAAHVRMLTKKLTCTDKAVSFLPIDKKQYYYPNKNELPEDKKISKNSS